MSEKESETEDVQVDSLEHSDSEESLRQLWWTIGLTVAAIGVMAYFYF